MNPYRPLWRISEYYLIALEGLERFCGISLGKHPMAPRNFTQALQLVENSFDFAGSTRAYEGETEFCARVQNLFAALKAGDRKAVCLLVQALRSHYEADEILSQEFKARCEKVPATEEEGVATEVWKELAHSRERTRLLKEAEFLERWAVSH